MSDQPRYGGAQDDAQEVDLVDLHEVEVLDEVRGRSGPDAEDVPDEVIDLDDDHVQEDDSDELEGDPSSLADGDDTHDHADDGTGEHLADADSDAADSDPDPDVMVLDSWQIQLAATGDEQVDAALARLTEVEGLPPNRHAEIYEAVHVGLTGALADLDRS